MIVCVTINFQGRRIESCNAQEELRQAGKLFETVINICFEIAETPCISTIKARLKTNQKLWRLTCCVPTTFVKMVSVEIFRSIYSTNRRLSKVIFVLILDVLMFISN